MKLIRCYAALAGFIVATSPIHGAFAQSDQAIVLNCPFQGRPWMNVMLDLQQKTVTQEITWPKSSMAHATITQITDQEITWLTQSDDPQSKMTGTLNRYTLELQLRFANGGVYYDMPCQLQHKQI